jgi:ParB family chromosome partitioning protein
MIRQIESIGIDKLVAHPANPNRMSGAAFKKLVGHIERTGNYEPVIVRPHPKRAGCFEIINGYHRVEALKQSGRKRCDCVVWQVDDTEALLLLATLNRLCGSDELDKKSELIKSLSKRFSTEELVGKLAESRKSIERLKELSRPVPLLNLRQFAKHRKVSLAGGHLTAKVFLNPLMFFLTDEQKKIVDEALAKAAGPNQPGTGAQKRAGAIVKIAETFLGVNAEEKRAYEG